MFPITKLLFICHGNICRSPMAEYVMKDIVKKAGKSQDFEIASAATSTEEIGNPVYPPVRALLSEFGISTKGHAARQLTKSDYDYYDLLITMDNANQRNTNRICGWDPDGKIHMLTEYSTGYGEVDDPWYTRDFATCYEEILAGCEGLFDKLTK